MRDPRRGGGARRRQHPSRPGQGRHEESRFPLPSPPAIQRRVCDCGGRRGEAARRTARDGAPLLPFPKASPQTIKWQGVPKGNRGRDPGAQGLKGKTTKGNKGEGGIKLRGLEGGPRGKQAAAGVPRWGAPHSCSPAQPSARALAVPSAPRAGGGEAEAPPSSSHRVVSPPP